MPCSPLYVTGDFRKLFGYLTVSPSERVKSDSLPRSFLNSDVATYTKGVKITTVLKLKSGKVDDYKWIGVWDKKVGSPFTNLLLDSETAGNDSANPMRF